MMLYLVCEGPGDGLDVRVLDLILAQKSQLLVRIEPAGGDSSLRSVARYLEERHRDARAYSIADRNYAPLAQVEALWNDPQSRHWMWRRHEIENYLLQPDVLAAMFAEWRALKVKGSAGLPSDSADTWEWLRKIAQPMLADHAGHVALYEVKGIQQNLDTRWLDPNRDTLERLPGKRYASQDAWMGYLENEGRRLQQACQSCAAAVEFSPGALLQRYAEVFAQINTPAFMEKDFLNDMAGHELLWGVCCAITDAGGHLSQEQLSDELIKAFGTTYHETLFDPDDFQNLADRLRLAQP